MPPLASVRGTHTAPNSTHTQHRTQTLYTHLTHNTHRHTNTLYTYHRHANTLYTHSQHRYNTHRHTNTLYTHTHIQHTTDINTWTHYIHTTDTQTQCTHIVNTDTLCTHIQHTQRHTNTLYRHNTHYLKKYVTLKSLRLKSSLGREQVALKTDLSSSDHLLRNGPVSCTTSASNLNTLPFILPPREIVNWVHGVVPEWI